ncbi:MAG TPA: family 20 glycosylhydrolase, partial [Pyrinomonadaceae bacterium]|nr:family 20 glycosylhydrolase [Pyrinomonadaceae bacterium]
VIQFAILAGSGTPSEYPEGYSLSVTPDMIQISGEERGVFYGLQSLMQLLPAKFDKEAKVPTAEIKDRPRFGYRGMHLDVGRHFMPVEFVKKYIDLMSQYKFNNFHWHLTEDQGWRIEIKKYPKLTEIGSKRPETMKEKNFTPYVGDGVPEGGFYTQEQIKDVVAYAKARYINVIPEIELPGHSSAAIAAYPELGCKADYKYKVQTTWGIFKEVYCPTEKTFGFLEDVLTEVIGLFPDSPYIHVGGDEVLKDMWKDSPEVASLMARENLKDEHEVQSYFIRRMEKFINSKGKKIIGWDEILEGGLAPNATVMSWRGIKGGIAAAKDHHDVIMTPTDYMYLDFGQGDPAYEPINIGYYTNLEKVYSFDPVPKELSSDEAKYILGGQANIWTEYMQTPEKVEYMAMPRMIALSEALWSRVEDKNFADFTRRMTAQYARLDKQNVNYRIPEPAGLKNTVLGPDEKVVVDLKSQIEGAKIYYTIDGTTPDEKSQVYSKPIDIDVKRNEHVDLKTVVQLASGRKSVVYAATLLR